MTSSHNNSNESITADSCDFANDNLPVCALYYRVQKENRTLSCQKMQTDLQNPSGTVLTHCLRLNQTIPGQAVSMLLLS